MLHKNMNNNTITGMISIIPKFDDENELDDLDVLGEYIFIIDRSGSMSGKRIEIAKEAIVLCIKSLPINS